jgi:hypothetical protein
MAPFLGGATNTKKLDHLERNVCPSEGYGEGITERQLS